MGAPFFSKKQKAQMRERRKKRKLACQAEQNNSESSETLTTPSGAKRPLEETETNEESKKKPCHDPSQDPGTTNKKQIVDLTTKTVRGKLYVVLPADLAKNDAKKFRKDARRQLRLDGKNDTEVEFVTEEQLPKTRKKHFPCIKELREQQKQLDQLNKEQAKRHEKIHGIPQEEKDKYVALDCEMVGIGSDGKKSALARVSLVDWGLNVLLDTFVKVPIRVTDFRTHVSGVEPKHIKNSSAMEVQECRELVASLLKDKVLVGHALTNDLKALMLTHTKNNIRDTARYRPFQRYFNGKWRPRKLRDLVKENLTGKEGFQEGEHDSVQDSKASMELFQVVRAQWEKELANKTK